MSVPVKFLPPAAVIIAVFGFAVSCPAQENTPTPEELQFEFDIMRVELRKPLAELQEKYDRALAQLETTEQEKGNLNSVIEIRNERGNFRDRAVMPEPAKALPKLDELRMIYERELARAESVIAPKEVTLYADYVSQLAELSKALTQKGEINEALKVTKMAEAAQEELAAMKIGGEEAGSGNEVVILGKGSEYEAHENCEVSQVEEKFLVYTYSGNAPVRSRESFQPPFRVLARAETNGMLRFYFGKSGIVIFNWDMRATTLRIGDPGTSLGDQEAFDNRGELEFGRPYEFELVVEPKSVSVKVDGRERGKLRGDFAETAVGPVGIGSSQGSRVLVDYFKVVPE